MSRFRFALFVVLALIALNAWIYNSWSVRVAIVRGLTGYALFFSVIAFVWGRRLFKEWIQRHQSLFFTLLLILIAVAILGAYILATIWTP
jgi:hypothetical protein